MALVDIGPMARHYLDPPTPITIGPLSPGDVGFV
jgi:hypothetical protein